MQMDKQMELINTGLNEDYRRGVVDMLNRLLADEHVLYIKTRNYHWNVTGPRFHSLHIFLEEQYNELAETIDEVAETARQFGGFAFGTMTEFLRESRLAEHPGRVPDEDTMLRDLLEDHQAIIRALRHDIDRSDEEYKAADAADFLTAVLEKHNKMAWMLRAFTPSNTRNAQVDLHAEDALTGSRR
jgi:starvation-inducible DNA-binding protein